MAPELLASTAIPSDKIADDTLESATQIASFLRKSVRQVNHLLETKQLPAFKLGGRWCMRKSTYRQFIEQLETAALKSATKQAA